MNVLELNNVVLSEKLQRERGIPKTDYKLYRLMQEVLDKLAPLRPMWKFEITGAQNFSGNTPDVLKVEVSEYGEMLGTIHRAWHASDYHLFISNDRIEEKMTRGSAYKTTSPEKAIAKIKKTFSRPSVNERVAKAEKLGEHIIDRQVSNMHRNIRDAKYNIHEAANKYVMGEGWPLFLTYVETLPTVERDRLLKHIQARDNNAEEMLTIEAVQAKFRERKTALVIKDAGKYVVKIGDSVQIYDDNTLPLNLRGGLGLLKLVDAEHFLASIGCRVNEEVFIVLVNEEGEST
jgi:hypothetical protein